MRSPLVTGAALVAALAIGIAGCGGGDTTGANEPPEATNLLAQKCPLEVVFNQESGMEEYADPAEDAWDTSEIIDMPLGEASQLAESNGCVIQVSVQDGKGLPVQLGLHPNRVLVWTEDNVVVNIEQVG